MRSTSSRSAVAAGLVSATLGAAASPASAGGFTTTRFGGEHGHAASSDLSSIYFNPAGLALGGGTAVYVEGLVAYRTVDYVRDAGAIDNPGTGTPADAEAANAGPASLANVLAAPFIGVATSLGNTGLSVGVAAYAPFGGQADWDTNEAYRDDAAYPGAVDGTQRWAAIAGAQRTLYGTLGVAWRARDRRIAVGLGLNAISSEVSLLRARNATGTDDVTGEGRSLLELTDTTFGLGLGVMWQATPDVRIGASYQGRPGFGEMSLRGTLTNKFGSAPETVLEDVELRQALPDILRVAAEVRLSDALVLRLAADWQRWSAFENQCLVDYAVDPDPVCAFNEDGSLDTAAGGRGVVVNLPRDWQDTFSGRVGAGYRVTPRLLAEGSVSLDTNAVPDETIDPSLFDMTKLIVQAGAQLTLGAGLFVRATLGQVVYFSRDVAPRAVDPAAPSRNPDMAGEYSQSVTYGLLGVGVTL
jgi:long-chain fatty acid transport protein